MFVLCERGRNQVVEIHIEPNNKALIGAAIAQRVKYVKLLTGPTPTKKKEIKCAFSLAQSPPCKNILFVNDVLTLASAQ